MQLAPKSRAAVALAEAQLALLLVLMRAGLHGGMPRLQSPHRIFAISALTQLSNCQVWPPNLP